MTERIGAIYDERARAIIELYYSDGMGEVTVLEYNLDSEDRSVEVQLDRQQCSDLANAFRRIEHRIRKSKK